MLESVNNGVQMKRVPLPFIYLRNQNTFTATSGE